jgi:acyl-CoA thioester hydrolase
MRQTNSHAIEVRVTYADTDQMGVVYYANYLVWFEMVRTEYFRARGIIYKRLEDEDKIYLPVVEAHCSYKAPARYDELITIKTWLGEIGRCRLTFEYEISRDQKVLTTGHTKHVFVDSRTKPIEIPDKIRKVFEIS